MLAPDINMTVDELVITKQTTASSIRDMLIVRLKELEKRTGLAVKAVTVTIVPGGLGGGVLVESVQIDLAI